MALLVAWFIGPYVVAVGTLAGVDLYAFANALTCGAIVGSWALIVGGWLAGILAPKHELVAARERVVGVAPTGRTVLVPGIPAQRRRWPRFLERLFRRQRLEDERRRPAA